MLDHNFLHPLANIAHRSTSRPLIGLDR